MLYVYFYGYTYLITKKSIMIIANTNKYTIHIIDHIVRTTNLEKFKWGLKCDSINDGPTL